MHHSQTYYEPPYIPPDGSDGLLIVLLIFAAFVAALIWVIYWEPEKKKKKDEKTLREEVDGIFKDLRDNALLYKREEFIPSLDRARDKVADALDKRELFNK